MLNGSTCTHRLDVRVRVCMCTFMLVIHLCHIHVDTIEEPPPKKHILARFICCWCFFPVCSTAAKMTRCHTTYTRVAQFLRATMRHACSKELSNRDANLRVILWHTACNTRVPWYVHKRNILLSHRATRSCYMQLEPSYTMWHMRH